VLGENARGRGEALGTRKRPHRMGEKKRSWVYEGVVDE